MKNTLTKIVPLMLVGLILIISLCGCSQSTSTTASTSTPTTPTAVITSTTATQGPAVELNVAAAASLTDVLKTLDDIYMKKNPNIKIVANFASSGTLQKQIEQGAPADIFFSAGASQMNTLQKEALIVNETRQDLLNNKVVLVVPLNGTLSIFSFKDLTVPNVTKIAIGDPGSVPAGSYAMTAFDTLGITASVKSKLILCSDVRQVLTYVQNGDVDAGVVYSTDAATTDKVKVVANAPDSVNAQIVYPIAVVKASKNADAAKAYVAFLASSEAKAIFEQYGFVVVKK